MDYGLYTAYLGMRSRLRTLDVIANNIANTGTTGFKADRLVYRSVESEEVEAMRQAQAQANPAVAQAQTAQTNNQPPGGTAPGDPASDPNAAQPISPSRVLGVTTGGVMDFTGGSIRETGRSLDVALAGDGFLVVQTPRGERYTRSGALTLDNAGQLVTAQGDLVIGESGPITIRPGEVSIAEDGSISAGGQVMDKLKLVQFQNPREALMKEGDSLFVATGTGQPQEAPQARVQQGMLESSNINAIEEMAAMMQNNREFESLQRSITQMMSLRKISAEIGRI
jgi:flagellar basal-body rod protein FlgG